MAPENRREGVSRYVTIRYRDGREYQVTPADFRRRKVVEGKDGKLQTHEEAGARIVAWNNGEPYEDDKAKAEPAPTKAEAKEVSDG